MSTRRLVLVRHAEAGTAPLDRDRPLTARGERQAAAVGEWLTRAGVVPDTALVSPSRRTTSTLDLLAAALPVAPRRDVDPRLYDATADEVLEAVSRTTAREVLLVVGHNPAMLDVALVLDGRPDPADRLARGFPPAAVAVFDVPGTFAELAQGDGRLLDVATPGR